MPNPDLGSLDRLHDIVTAPPVSWWPPAPGWYLVGAGTLAVVAVAVWNTVARRRRNRYRRDALRELNALVAPVPLSRHLAESAELLKRTALAGFPRERVASLTGDDWLAFLDATDRPGLFTTGPGRLLGEAVYQREAAVDAATWSELTVRIRHWIRHHRC